MSTKFLSFSKIILSSKYCLVSIEENLASHLFNCNRIWNFYGSLKNYSEHKKYYSCWSKAPLYLKVFGILTIKVSDIMTIFSTPHYSEKYRHIITNLKEKIFMEEFIKCTKYSRLNNHTELILPYSTHRTLLLWNKATKIPFPNLKRVFLKLSQDVIL